MDGALEWVDGTPAVVVDDHGMRWRTRLRSSPFKMSGMDMVMIEGISGGYTRSRVTLGDDPGLLPFAWRPSRAAEAVEQEAVEQIAIRTLTPAELVDWLAEKNRLYDAGYVHLRGGEWALLALRSVLERRPAVGVEGG